MNAAQNRAGLALHTHSADSRSRRRRNQSARQLGYAECMDVFDEKRAELEQFEFMMGLERGRLAVALDLLTDALILVGQHGVYCTSSRNPSKPALDLQAVLGGMEGAKLLIQSVMEELRKSRDNAAVDGK